MNMNKGDDPDEAAIRWAARRMSQEMSAEEWSAYESWRAIPENLEAEARLDDALTRVDAAGPDALAKSFEEELFSAAEAEAEAEGRAGGRHFPLAASVAAAVFALAAVITVVGRSSTSPAEILITERGEIKMEGLPDGSAVNLNSNTQLSIRYKESRRVAEIDKGDVHFNVVSNPDRPFLVKTPHAEVSVVGTSFAVSVRDDVSSIYVTSGNVVAGARDMRVSLFPGDYVAIDAVGEVSAVEAFEEDLALSWREGVARFRGAKLKDVVRELNRHFDKVIAFDAAEIGDRRVTGEFDIQDQAAAVAALALAFDLAADERDDRIVLVRTAQ